MNKINLKKVVDAMKSVANLKKPEVKKEVGGVKVRDMRQEAKDLGSHGANEYFGEQK